jgi:hypothetical protein
MKTITKKNLVKGFEYLDSLRESRITNMFGARPYVQQAFPKWGPEKAGKVLTTWMKTFSNETPKERAIKGLALITAESTGK